MCVGKKTLTFIKEIPINIAVLILFPSYWLADFIIRKGKLEKQGKPFMCDGKTQNELGFIFLVLQMILIGLLIEWIRKKH